MQVCSAHGSCVDIDSCKCNSGFSGDSCDIFQCNSINSTDINVCSGHGTCIAPDSCVCNLGYKGKNCEVVTCFGLNSTDINVCSGNGMCVGPNVCKCNITSTSVGFDCSHYKCGGVNNYFETDSRVCSGHGSCIVSSGTPTKTPVCKCLDGWIGDSCSGIFLFAFLLFFNLSYFFSFSSNLFWKIGEYNTRLLWQRYLFCTQYLCLQIR